jgi:hypothetical protein
MCCKKYKKGVAMSHSSISNCFVKMLILTIFLSSCLENKKTRLLGHDKFVSPEEVSLMEEGESSQSIIQDSSVLTDSLNIQSDCIKMTESYESEFKVLEIDEDLVLNEFKFKLENIYTLKVYEFNFSTNSNMNIFYENLQVAIKNTYLLERSINIKIKRFLYDENQSNCDVISQELESNDFKKKWHIFQYEMIKN